MIYITSNNVAQYAKIQNTNTHVTRDDVLIMWDELSKKERKLAENIDIDVQVETSDPSSVPEKWNDNIIIEGDNIGEVDLVKQLVSNPSRAECFELLVENSPSEPLMLWWLPHVFNTTDFFKTASEVCHYGLFKTNSDYIWGAVAFGSTPDEAKFYWPKSKKDDKDEKKLKKELIENGIPKKEVEEAWEHIKEHAHEYIDSSEDEDVGVVPEGVSQSEDVENEESEKRSASSLLDL